MLQGHISSMADRSLCHRTAAGPLLAVTVLRMRLRAAEDQSSSHAEEDHACWMSEPEPRGTAPAGEARLPPGRPCKAPRFLQAVQEPGCVWLSRLGASLPKLPMESPGMGWLWLGALQQAHLGLRVAGGCADGKRHGDGEVGVAIFSLATSSASF